METQCLPFLPTILSLSITIFMGVIAFVIHMSGGEQRRGVSRSKAKSRSVQTECDADVKGRKETSIAKQLKHQKLVACNLEEENEALIEQLNSLKRTSNERKGEVSILKEQLEEANARCQEASAKCEQLSTALKKLQDKEDHPEKKTDAEFQNAMAMLLDLAEQSVNREIVRMDGKKKNKKSLLDVKPQEFSPEDWAFMMSLSEDRMKEFEQVDMKVISRQQFEVPTVQLLYNEPSPTAPNPEKTRAFPEIEKAIEGPEATSSTTRSPELRSLKPPSLDALSTCEENLSPDPNDASDESPKAPLLDMLDLSETPTGTWASQCTTPVASETHESIFNPNAKPFVPKRQQLQEEIQKRLQQWKDFYYTQVQPQEAATQQPAYNWAEATPRNGNSRRRHQFQNAPPAEWDQAQYYQQYYEQMEMEPPHPHLHEGAYDNFVPQLEWDQTPHPSEHSEEVWQMQEPAAPSCDGTWTSHQPYTCHCQCTSCLNEQSYSTASAPEEHLDLSQSSRCSEGQAESILEADRQQRFSDPILGLSFAFPNLAKGEHVDPSEWILALEAHEPFYLARYTPKSGSVCQIVITEEHLQPQHTLGSYVELSKQQTERTLASYHLVFQNERQFFVSGCEAFEVTYVQASGDMLVWSLCVLTFGRVITIQIVAANGTKQLVLQALRPMVESIQLVAPIEELATHVSALSGHGAACMTIQRAARCWLARREVQRIRTQQQREELEENDVFIRVTTRINPKFSR